MVEFIPFRECDSPVLPNLLEKIPQGEHIGTVTADWAYDTGRCHSAITARGGTAVIPIRKTDRLSKEDCAAAWEGNESIRATNPYPRRIHEIALCPRHHRDCSLALNLKGKAP